MKYYVAIACTLLFLAAGCASSDGNGSTSGPFVGGSGGLAASFAEAMPPPVVFDDAQGEFGIGIVLQNIGESSIGPGTLNPYGHIEIIGITPQNYGLFSQRDLFVTFAEADVVLEPTRRIDGRIIPGESTLVSFEGLTYVPNIFGDKTETIRANICYEYRTYAQGSVCIKDNLLELATDDSICSLSGAKQVSSSAAPIQVRNLVQTPVGRDRIQVTFNVVNVGGGNVYQPYSLSGPADRSAICSPSAGVNRARDIIHARVTLGASNLGFDISCQGFTGGNEGFVRMPQGSATVTCTVNTRDVDAGRVAIENFNIELFYTYMQFIQTPIVIRDTELGFVEPGLQ